jgi:hypothetical protein
MTTTSFRSGAAVREGSWKDFRDSVKEVNQGFYEVIEQINPSDKYGLIEVTCPYGEKITDLGTICLPDKDGVFRRLDDPRLPNKYRELLGYCPTPLTLQLTNGAEVFVDTTERIIPLNIFAPGDLYGLFEALMPLTGCPISPCWSVTAGARSVFLGAKVTDAIGHKRLKEKYGVKVQPPNKLHKQWEIIKTIASRSDRETPWTCKILLFSKEWFEEKNNDNGWLRFQNFLLKESWIQSKYMRSKSELSIMWEAFALAVRDAGLKPGSYLLDTLMHEIFLANGAIPGFVVADDSELLLPSLSIENAYENDYQLKEYASIVMHAWRFGQMGNYHPLHYSLAYPTMLEGTPTTRHLTSSIISELRDLKELMKTLQHVWAERHILAYDLLKDVTIEYYHSEEDKFQQIKNSSLLLKDNPELEKNMLRFKDKIFPHQGPFFRGCLRISKK